MKYSFNFIQIANWIYIVRKWLEKLVINLEEENFSRKDAILLLRTQKKHLELIKDTLNKKNRLLGIQPEFFKNLEKIKKQYGIEE